MPADPAAKGPALFVASQPMQGSRSVRNSRYEREYERAMSTGVSELHAFDAAVNAGRVPYKVKDLALAELGRKEIRLAEHEMPGLMAIRARYKGKKPLAGARVMGSLHMTVQTAVLIETLAELGADVRWVSCNIFSTQDPPRPRSSSAVRRPAARSQQPEGHAGVRVEGRDARGVLVVHERGAPVARRQRPDRRSSTMAGTRRCCCTRASSSRRRDGAGVRSGQGARGVGRHPRPAARRAEGQSRHAGRRSRPTCAGVSEETTTGVHRLYQMMEAGTLLFPAINVNDSVTKSKFDNIYGCRHSLIDGLNRATDVMIGGKVAVVAGYGEVGKGCAQALRGQGCRVIVAEIDPICALQAAMEGYEVKPVEDVVVDRGHLRDRDGQPEHHHRRHMARMKHNAIIGNIGHFDNEIDMAGLKKRGIERIEIKPQYDEFRFPDGHSVLILAEGRLLNLGLRDRPSELRDVGVVHQPGDRAARAAPAQRQVREEGLHPAEAPRRGSRAAAPRPSRREAHDADAGTGRVSGCAGRRSVQAGYLPLLIAHGDARPSSRFNQACRSRVASALSACSAS